MTLNPQYAPAVFALIGVLVGFVGNFFLQLRLFSWQRKHWIRDKKQAEWGELITTLCESARSYIDNAVVDPSGFPLRGRGDWSKCEEAKSEALRVIQDRIFIAERVAKEKLVERWNNVTKKKPYNEFIREWRTLHADVVQMAKNDLGMN